ncbi:hypothetical protein GCM10017691_21110 [Pseudonocardia petroleophila]
MATAGSIGRGRGPACQSAAPRTRAPPRRHRMTGSGGTLINKQHGATSVDIVLLTKPAVQLFTPL